jgi:hypothetical protein
MIKEDCEEYISQKQMIKEFIETFYKRHGYKPIVVSKASEVETMSLEQLKLCFTPFLPHLYGKTVFLETKCRIREVVELRQMYCYVARTMGYRLTDIGRSLKQADHSTAIHSIRAFRNLVDTDSKYKQKFTKIFNYIKAESNESSIMANSNKVEDNA